MNCTFKIMTANFMFFVFYHTKNFKIQLSYYYVKIKLKHNLLHKCENAFDKIQCIFIIKIKQSRRKFQNLKADFPKDLVGCNIYSGKLLNGKIVLNIFRLIYFIVCI